MKKSRHDLLPADAVYRRGVISESFPTSGPSCASASACAASASTVLIGRGESRVPGLPRVADLFSWATILSSFIWR